MNRIRKRLTAGLAALCLLLTALAVPGLAAEDALMFSKTTVLNNETDTFDMTFTQPETVEASSMGLVIQFDNTAFEITEIARAPYAAIQPDLAGCNKAGNIGLSYTDPTTDPHTTISKGEVLLSATFRAKSTAELGEKTFTVIDYNISGAYRPDTYDFEDLTPEWGAKTKTVTIVAEIDPSISLPITAPVKGATPQKAEEIDVAGRHFKVTSLSWEPNTATFGSATSYKANVSLTADTGYVFAASSAVTVAGGSVSGTKVEEEGSKLSFAVTFPATAGANQLLGTVTVDNTAPKFGDTLTAQTGALDYNGEAAGTLSYTWYRGSDAIAGASAGTYKITAEDVGKTIKVEVRSANNSGSVTSAPTAAVEKADCATVAVAPELSHTDTTVTVTNAAGTQEYAITTDDAEPESGWNTTGEFTGLSANTEYTVYTRVKETATHKRSESVSASVTTDRTKQVITVTDAAPKVRVGATLDLKTLCSSNAKGATLSFTLDGSLPEGTDFAEETGVITAGNTPGSFAVRVNAEEFGAYTAAEEKMVNVTIIDKESDTSSMTVTQEGCDYGEELPDYVLSGKPEDAGTDDVLYTGTLRKGGAYSAAEKPTEAGTYTVKVTCETADTVYEATSESFTIAPKDIADAEIELGGTLTYTGQAQTQAVVSVTLGEENILGDCDVTGNTQTNAGAYSLTVTAKDASNFTGSAEKEFTIEKKSITPAVDDIAAVDFDGSEKQPAVFVKDGETSLAATDYEVYYSNNVNAGMAKATVKAAAEGNYAFADVEKEFEIRKIAYGKEVSAEKNVIVGKEQTGVTVDLTAQLGSVDGAAISAVTESEDADELVSNVTGEGLVVKFDVASVADAGKTAKISATVTSTNYEDITATVTITTVAKAEAAVTFTGEVPQSVVYGTSFSVNAAVTDEAEGEWSWSVSDPTVLAITGDGSAASVKAIKPGSSTITAAYESDAAIGEATTASITVEKATVTVKALNKSIYVGGEVPDLSNPVSGTDYTVTGLVEGDTLSGSVVLTYSETPSSAAAATYTITPSGVTADAEKYNDVVFEAGTLTVSNRSSGGGGGGGGGSSSTYTVQFNTNGGSTVKSQSVKKNATLSEPAAPTKDGYVFDGWYTDKELTQKYDFSEKVTKGMTLYAKWVEAGGSTTEPSTTEPGTTEPGTTEPGTTEPGTTEPASGFADVPEGSWFYEAVQYATEHRLMNGVSGTEFAPDGTLTRGMLVTVLYRSEGEPAVNKSVPFGDVAADAYYANAVIWAQQNGIVNGISGTEFAPERSITREQIAAIIYRYASFKGYDMSAGQNTSLLVYSDAASVSEYAAEAMQYMVGAGLMQGKSGTTLDPLSNATRAETAAILQRFLSENQ